MINKYSRNVQATIKYVFQFFNYEKRFLLQESGSSTPINLQKLLTPASDSNELLHLNKSSKLYILNFKL